MADTFKDALNHAIFWQEARARRTVELILIDGARIEIAGDPRLGRDYIEVKSGDTIAIIPFTGIAKVLTKPKPMPEEDLERQSEWDRLAALNQRDPGDERL